MGHRIAPVVVASVLIAGLLGPTAPTATANTSDTVTPTAGSIPRGNCPNPPQATAPPLPGGALAMYCVPAVWNGNLVVWAHGYVDITQPLGFYNLNFPDGQGGTVFVPDLVEALGFAFAATSYRSNGLVILEGVQDIEALVDGFAQATGKPKPQRTYQTGASEGGIISTLLAERSPQRFSGALAMCGPIGDFKGQINYVGDMRVLFDLFYPGVLPGSAADIPPNLISNWDSTYKPAVQRAIAANPDRVRQMYRVLHAPVNPDPALLDSTAVDVLWYNVFGTNDARSKLGGNPFDNRARLYLGSDNDVALNLLVKRYKADPAAVANLAPYQTTGRPGIPLVTLHTRGDDIIPYWHEVLYFFKVASSGTQHVTQLPVDAYGHCHFTVSQILTAFELLLLQTHA